MESTIEGLIIFLTILIVSSIGINIYIKKFLIAVSVSAVTTASLFCLIIYIINPTPYILFIYCYTIILSFILSLGLGLPFYIFRFKDMKKKGYTFPIIAPYKPESK